MPVITKGGSVVLKLEEATLPASESGVTKRRRRMVVICRVLQHKQRLGRDELFLRNYTRKRENLWISSTGECDPCS